MSRPIQSDGRLHGVVIALRREDGQWLAIRRSYTVAAPGKVCFPGGAVEVGETQEQAVVREAREELGLEVRPVERVWRWESPTSPLTLWGWVAEVADWGTLRPDPAEVAEVMWMTTDEVPAHPDALPTNEGFCACLKEHCAAGGAGGLTVGFWGDTKRFMADSGSASNKPTGLEPLRAQIDALDEKIVQLLNERAKVVVEIGKVKQQSNAPIYAPDREKAVMEKVRRLNKGPLPDRCLEAVWRELMSGSFALEKPLRIGYLGPDGTHSHGAAVRKFGSSVEYVGLADIPSVFTEVVRGHIDYGLVPVENSIGGGIVDTLDAFLHSSAKVCAEVLINIHHNLLAKEPWEKVTKILSKPEIFAQCRNWLAATAKDRDIQPAASSSKAAELAATEAGVAAIGTRQAGELYGLHVLFENIEDNPDNVTRFFVISRESARKSGDDKTAIMFTTAHKPGALAEVLDVFKENGINLTDIEKRPSKKVNWEYYFFIDAQGHMDDPGMKKAIEEARQHCLQLTVLGSYPRATEVL